MPLTCALCRIVCTRVCVINRAQNITALRKPPNPKPFCPRAPRARAQLDRRRNFSNVAHARPAGCYDTCVCSCVCYCRQSLRCVSVVINIKLHFQIRNSIKTECERKVSKTKQQQQPDDLNMDNALYDCGSFEFPPFATPDKGPSNPSPRSRELR